VQALQHPHALTIYEDHVYYTDRRLQVVQMYAKYANGSVTADKKRTFATVLGVVAVHNATQPTYSSMCIVINTFHYL
jgi:hypothetical protein